MLFRSAARVAGRSAVGVILTGMGKDGAEGMLELRQAGATTLGQDEESSLIYGMPRVAFERGGVMRQYSLAQMADAILDACDGAPDRSGPFRRRRMQPERFEPAHERRQKQCRRDQDNAHCKLPPVLDLGAAEDFSPRCGNICRASGSLRLDASAVETLTLPASRSLVAAMRDHGQISIEQPSTEFANAFQDLGLSWPNNEVPESPSAGGPRATLRAGAPSRISRRKPNRQTTQLISTMSRRTHATWPRRILTIDDSKTMRDMLMLTLSDAGFDVLQAVDGQDGLDVLGDERVDVVITDINMPRMDGYEVIRQLRKNPVTRRRRSSC